MSAENQQLATVEPPQQLITIEPKVYVDLVFEPFVKRYADGVDAIREVAYDIKTTAGMAVAVKFRALFRAIRTESENARKIRKAPILEIGRLLDSRKGEIEAISLPLETLFDEEIKAEENRKEAEKQAKLAVERQRVESIQAKIDEIRHVPATFALKSAAELKAEADRLSETVISLDEFAEFTGEAMQARGKAAEQLRELQESAEEMEAAQARLAEERAQFERERAAAEESDRQAAAARAEQEAKDRAERERVEAQQRAEREAEQRKLDEQRREFEQQQADLLAQQQALREATEKLAREQREREEAIEAAAKIEADHGEALIENARIDAERASAVEARRIADQQAADAARLEAERVAAVNEQARRAQIQFEAVGPDADEILSVLADHYDVTKQVVQGWLYRHAWAQIEIAA